MSAAILLSFGFGQLFKWSQRRQNSAPVVVTANYIVLATLLSGYYLSQNDLNMLLCAIAIAGVVLGVVSIPLVAYGGASFSQ